MSMSDRDGKIWFDGQLIDWRDAKIHVLSHSLHYGLSVFEGVRAYDTELGTAIFRLPEHTRRLLNSAKIFQMKVPFDAATLEEAQKAVVRENGLKSCYLRPLIWLGDDKLGVSPRGVKVHVMIAAWPWGAYLGEDGINKGIRVKTSSYTRHHVNVSMVRAKAGGHYINSILANNEALADGYDEAMLLDTEGYVSEGSGENLFIVKQGKLYTPDLASCLDGITRDSILTIARNLGIEAREKRITRDEVYCADEAFFTGTAAEVTPIRERGHARPHHHETADRLLRCRQRQGSGLSPLAAAGECLSPPPKKAAPSVAGRRSMRKALRPAMQGVASHTVGRLAP